jgi:quercetin dioxygenase-like cupin family protein
MIVEERPQTGHVDERRAIQDMANNLPPGRKWAYIQSRGSLFRTLKDPARATDTLIVPIESGVSLSGGRADINIAKNNLNTAGGRDESFGLTHKSEALFLPEGNCEFSPIPVDTKLTILEPKHDGSVILPPIKHDGKLLDIRFVGRIETSKPDIRLGDHSHRNPDHFEIFFVTSGNPNFIYGSDVGTDFYKTKIRQGSIIIIPPGIAHTFLGDETFTIVPVSTIPFDENDKDLFSCDAIKKVK